MHFVIQSVTGHDGPGLTSVRGWLREHNWMLNRSFMEKWQVPENAAQPLNLLATQDGVVIGGLLAETQFAWLKIALMAVHPEHRACGIGSSLLLEAERIAIERLCRHAYVDTMEYQAYPFYVKHGFATAGKIVDWDSHGHAKFFLTKELVPQT